MQNKEIMMLSSSVLIRTYDILLKKRTIQYIYTVKVKKIT